jgi:hypothetical protein
MNQPHLKVLFVAAQQIIIRLDDLLTICCHAVFGRAHFSSTMAPAV